MIKGLVTILIPTLNRPDYLKQTLSSVLNQSYKNIEIIVSDNGSNYDVRDFLSDYLIDKRIIFRKNLKTISASNHFNQCIYLANGEFFIIISDDDFISENFIYNLVDAYVNNPSLSVCLPASLIIDRNNKIDRILEPPDWTTKSGSHFILDWLNGRFEPPVATFITIFTKTDLLKKIHGYPDFILGAHIDNAVIINLSMNGDIAFIQDSIFYYRVYRESFGLSLSPDALAISSKELVEYLKKINYTDKILRKQVLNGAIILGFRTFINRSKEIYKLRGKKLLISIFKYRLNFTEFVIISLFYLKSVVKNVKG